MSHRLTLASRRKIEKNLQLSPEPFVSIQSAEWANFEQVISKLG